MGGTVLREDIIIENERYEIIGEVDAWETCLWSIKVFFKVRDKKSSKEKEFEYSNLTREVFNRNGYNRRIDNERIKGILETVGDLIILKGLNETYYKGFDPIEDLENEMDMNLYKLI
jgi:hypothetical protein